ncbi:MAG TPA: hypothetical protein RMG48_18575 [Myxococcales bacterium LLY-WYZ-16_1]|nr:hypothetical protein [Myxococcales bacterium LLY-WYZ-16_1]
MTESPWTKTPNVCGSCIAWRPDPSAPSGPDRSGASAAAPDAPASDGESGPDPSAPNDPIGSCRMRPELGRVPASLPKCPLYRARGTAPTEPAPARRRSRTGTTPNRTAVRRARDAAGEPSLPPAPAAPAQRPRGPRAGAVSAEARPWRDAGFELLARELGPARDLRGRFEGGTVEVRDAQGGIQPYPMEVFFRRLVRFRNALDQLESAVDSADGLASEASALVSQVRKIHGTWTSFNVLFEEQIDHFSGKG